MNEKPRVAPGPRVLIANREYLFGNSESGVASLVLWHFVEEIEHKNVTYDIFNHLHGNYFRRVHGVLFALIHIMSRTRSGYRALLEADGLWRNWRSRLALARDLIRIFSSLTPKLLRILTPGYNPRQVRDPPWARLWANLYERDRSALRLDTSRLDAPEPIALPSPTGNP